MAELRTVVEKVRSKNAGPFWLTIDIFCGAPGAFETVRAGLATQAVADALGQPVDMVRRFDIATLFVVKLSLPRPSVQGAPDDRDMHGASWAALIGEIDLN